MNWTEVIDILNEWGRDPRRFDDEGIEPPTSAAIVHALELANCYRSLGSDNPDSVVPDPNGGIVFERREGDVIDVVHVWSDGSSECRRYHGFNVTNRAWSSGRSEYPDPVNAPWTASDREMSSRSNKKQPRR